MTQLYNKFDRPENKDENNDYGQFWDTEDQRPIYQTSISVKDDNEYEYYVDEYELLLNHQEHMLEYEYNKKYNPTIFSTIGFALFIIKEFFGFFHK